MEQYQDATVEEEGYFDEEDEGEQWQQVTHER